MKPSLDGKAITGSNQEVIIGEGAGLITKLVPIGIFAVEITATKTEATESTQGDLRSQGEIFDEPELIHGHGGEVVVIGEAKTGRVPEYRIAIIGDCGEGRTHRYWTGTNTKLKKRGTGRTRMPDEGEEEDINHRSDR